MATLSLMPFEAMQAAFQFSVRGDGGDLHDPAQEHRVSRSTA
jgi:hypothetical protein